MVHFYGTDYRAHNSCMTEAQKYQGALYKPKRQKSNGFEPSGRSETMAHNAYVEDVTEEFEDYRQYQVYENDGNIEANLPPEAPTPPPAVIDDPNVNVFDFLIDQTPNVSNVNLQYYNNMAEASGGGGGGGGRQLVRFDQGLEDNYIDPTGYMVDDEAMAQYGPDGVPAIEYQTPAPKTHRRKSKDSEREVKKDKKRKRLHIETSGPLALTTQLGDEVMTDAPPVLHSGLTGGLNRLMRPSQFPPSPDYSGGDGGENSPASPIKKTKHSKSHKTKPSRTETLSGGLKAFMSGTSKSKISKKRKHSSDKDKKDKKTRRHSSSDKVPKLIEYRPKSKSGDEKEGESGQMILYKPRSDVFLSLCNKGPESERGCSVNKALKRYHRERSDSGTSLGKSVEEKELWRSLRMRRNERGEIVLFSIEP
ncbi:hypothetical protein F4781DRAFT_433633 [Annulohypoxylon bovei var. microspora]|nr:hypothetical protein F4781DRAFT_433633 [Annulohypoxylon bovei var. microspora]